ncbi:MAG: helix-turn-helix transcriptional regulator, partial [Bacteroidetes bacterium]|nr:helix-turn-helix transcriptional regulator [Bacteroidota bacterium]
PVVPPGLSSLVVPGSIISSAEGPFGKMMFQEINAGHFKFFYNVYRIQEDLALDFSSPEKALFSHIALRGSLRHDLEGIGPLLLKMGQFNFLHYPYIRGTTYLERNHEYHTFNISYNTTQLQELLPFFPFLESMLVNIASGRHGLLFKNNGWINAQIRDLADYALGCPFEDELRRFYFDLKMKEFLVLLLVQEQKRLMAPDKMTRSNFDSIQESRHIIDTRYDVHITLSDIARQVGLNEFKLKTGFRRLFGIGMFEYLLQTRMQKARTLLLETRLPIKEVARRTGYTSKQSFQNAFKKYYDETPGSFRRM